MNSRYFLTADSPCNIGNSVSVSSVLQMSEERPAATASNLRNSSAPRILIMLAMKISRARWYSFLRRVFHYQNGSGSDLGPNPFNSWKWMLLEFVCLVVQISVAVYTLIVSRRESPVWPMRIWVSGYAFLCFISIVLLHWRYRVVFTFQRDPNSNLSDVEQQRSEESRNLQKFSTWVELLFAIWFVMGNIWVFDSRFGSYNGAPKLHVLCVSLLAWNAVSYSFPFILFVLLCCCVPFLSGLLGYNINTASLDRGATDDQIAILPCWKYRQDDAVCDLELGDENDLECCICLAKYRENEDMKKLPCNHIFHRRCVDQWLKIISCCPLCKQQINK